MWLKERWNLWKWPNGEGHGYSDGYKRLVPLFVRRYGGGWAAWAWWWASYPWACRWIALHYLDNLYMDVRAQLCGDCNAFLLKGGWTHWRCLRRRGHRMPHRAHSYVWNGIGPPRYEPLTLDGHEGRRHVQLGMRQRNRHITKTFRQWLAWRAELELARRQR